MALHRFTSEVSDKLSHLPSLGVKHFPFNVELFSVSFSTKAADPGLLWTFVDEIFACNQIAAP
jgi:hypothetical protein